MLTFNIGSGQAQDWRRDIRSAIFQIYYLTGHKMDLTSLLDNL